MSARRTAGLIALLGGALLGSCSKDSTAPNPTVAAIHVTPGVDSIGTLGRTITFAAQAVDANGAPVSATVVWRSSNPSVATVDSATGLATAVTNGTTVISAHVGSVSGQGTMAVSQAVAAVQVSPPSATLTTVGVTTQFTAVAQDSGGASVTGVRFLWVSSDPSVAVVDTNGLARSKGPGQAFITAAGRGFPGSAVMNVSQVAHRLAFSAAPPAMVAGQPSGAIQVEIRDSAGAIVAGARDLITLAADSGPAGTLGGVLTVAPINGVATFIGVSFNGLVGTHTVTATATGLVSGESASFAVGPGPVASIAWQSGGNSTRVVGDSESAWTFALFDQFGNAATTATDTVHLAVAQSPWGSHLRGPTAAVPVNGVVTFSGFTVDRPGTAVRLKATVSSVESPASPTTLQDTLPTLAQASVAGGTVCGAGDGRGFCWGANGVGQIGNGTKLSDSVPVLVKSPVPLVSVWAADESTCGLTASGAAYCWGQGYGTLPTTLAGGLTFSKLSGGSSHMCGLATTGAMYCWGDDEAGQLGDAMASGGFTTTPVAVVGGLTFTDVAVGGASTCAVATGGDAYCWGVGVFGTLGTGATANDSVPTLAVGGHKYRTVSVTIQHACGLATDSSAFCWGTNDNGELGDSTTNPDSVPVTVVGGLKFQSVVVGNGYSCGLDATTEAFCWGSNGFLPPSLAPQDGSFATPQIIGALWGGCLFEANRLMCWGINNQLQLGNGSSADNSSPQFVVRQ